MRITLAVALVALSSSAVLAQESSQTGTITDEAAGDISTAAVIVSEELGTVAPVAYQSGTVGDRAADVVEAASGGTIEGSVITEPSSVVTGEVIQSAPVYSEGVPMEGVPMEGVPMEGGTVISEGGAMMTGSPVVDAPMATPSCGCGSASAAPMTYSNGPVATVEAPVVSYSNAPVQYSAPASNPCCNQPRRGFFRALFGN